MLSPQLIFDLGDLFSVTNGFNKIHKILCTQIMLVRIMSTKNTLANLDTRNKGRFDGPFHTQVNTLFIKFTLGRNHQLFFFPFDQ